ncbi:hypothetical protein BH11PSE11_BH11PSE11_08630 [soil metagenome]
MSATILHTAFFNQASPSRAARSSPRIVFGPADQVIHLDSKQYMSLRDAVGSVIKPLSGTLWITLDGDSRDVVVKAGESFVVDRPGKTLISPLGEARVCIKRDGGESKLSGRVSGQSTGLPSHQ